MPRGAPSACGIRIATALLAAAVSSSCATADKAAIHDGCERQVEAHAREVLGFAEFTTSWAWSQDWRWPSRAGLRRPGCDQDEYVLVIRKTYDECHAAHYGRIPNYIVHGYWTGNCNSS